MKKYAWMGFVLGVGMLGCGGGSSATSKETGRVPAAQTAFAAGCDAKVSGKDGRDGELTRLQAKLGEPGAGPSAYVVVGYTWVRKARAEAAPGLYRNAEACAQQALALVPGDALAQGLRGMIMLNDHRFAEARALATELLARDAHDVTALGLLSDAALELGDREAAIDAAQRMVDEKPSLLSYGRAAHLRWLQGDVPGAKRLYERAIAAGAELKDREPRAWMIVQAALVFWHAGDYAGADAGFDLALREQPEYAPALEGKGRVALSRGDARAAVSWLERAERKSPLVETAWLLGDAYRLSGDRARAEQAYERVEREGKAHDPRTLALFYATKKQRADEALRLAQLEYAGRKDLYGKDVLAYALLRSGDVKAARALSREVVAHGTPDARLLFRAGEIAKAAGDAGEGETLVAQARQLNRGVDPVYLEGAL
jgi:tetratricopeptide (TPR) repeat protein